MIEISKFIIVEKIFDKYECEKILNSKSDFVESSNNQRDDKFFTIPNQQDYTFGHTNYPAWLLENTEENKWCFDKLEDYIEKINDEFFQFKNDGLWNSYIKQYEEGESCSWHFDDMSRGKRLGISLMLKKPIKGGEFEIFNGEKVSIDVKVGEIVIFPTFIFHKVNPIIKGKRLTLITWMYSDSINF